MWCIIYYPNNPNMSPHDCELRYERLKDAYEDRNTYVMMYFHKKVVIDMANKMAKRGLTEIALDVEEDIETDAYVSKYEFFI